MAGHVSRTAALVAIHCSLGATIRTTNLAKVVSGSRFLAPFSSAPLRRVPEQRGWPEASEKSAKSAAARFLTLVGAVASLTGYPTTRQ